jgi:hypothetical protein
MPTSDVEVTDALTPAQVQELLQASLQTESLFVAFGAAPTHHDGSHLTVRR